MTEAPTQHGWTLDALFSEALLYVGEMERHAPDDWRHRLWASLSVELLARAALAHISPTLLADRQDWRNTYHALGHGPTKRGFAPRSIGIVEVLKILGELLPEFTPELHDSCVEQCGYRNAELHSGEDAFAGRGMASWLSQYFASCQVFLVSMGKTLGDLFSDPSFVEDMIASLKRHGGEERWKGHRRAQGPLAENGTFGATDDGGPGHYLGEPACWASRWMSSMRQRRLGARRGSGHRHHGRQAGSGGPKANNAAVCIRMRCLWLEDQWPLKTRGLWSGRCLRCDDHSLARRVFRTVHGTGSRRGACHRGGAGMRGRLQRILARKQDWLDDFGPWKVNCCRRYDWTRITNRYARKSILLLQRFQ